MRIWFVLRISVMFLCLLLLSNGLVCAQEVLYSAVEKGDTHSGDFGVIGKVSGRLWTYHHTDEGYMLQMHDDSMNLLATAVLDFMPEKSSVVEIVAFPAGMMLVYDTRVKGKSYAVAALLDGSGRLVGKPRTLEEKEGSWLGGDNDETQCAVSDNREHILVYTVHTGREGAKLHGYRIDPALTVVKKTDAEFSSKQDLQTGDALVGDDGSVYWAVASVGGRYDFSEKTWIMHLAAAGGLVRTIALPLEGTYSAGTVIKLDNRNGNLYAAGFYAAGRTGNLEGTYSYTIATAADSITAKSRSPFSEAIRNGTGERSTRRALNNYVLRGLIIKNDGGLVVLSESYFVTTNNAVTPFGYYGAYFGPFTGSSIREFNYGDILAISYSREGTEEWHSFIRKTQYSQEDNGAFSSYAFLNAGGSLLFLYNDYDRSRSRIQLSNIGAAGDVVAKELPIENNSPDWLPRRGVQVSARQIVVPCLRRRGLCFAKVVF